MVPLPNFKAVGRTQAELHSLKVEKLDVCMRPSFNLLTYYIVTYHDFVMALFLFIACGRKAKHTLTSCTIAAATSIQLL